MKFQNIIFKLTLCVLIGSNNLNAQYDSGTVIYSETNNANLTSVLKNYIVVDFDGDSFTDILFIKDGELNQLSWYKGDGSGNFSEQENLLEITETHKENEIFYTDMNEDGINDIVFQNSDTGFTTLLNDRQGNISAQIDNEVTTEEFVGTDLMELADVDDDGDMDGIFFTKLDNYDYFFWSNTDMHYGYGVIGYNDGSGTLSNYRYLENEKEVLILVKSGDVDGDGDTDIICSGNKEIVKNGGFGLVSYENPFIRFYENLGVDGIADKVEIELPTVDEAETDFMNIKLQDLNKDGTVELLVEHAIKDECESDLHLYNCVYFYQFQVLDYHTQNEAFISLQKYNTWFHDYTLKKIFMSYNELYDEAFQIQFGNQNADNNLDILSINVPQGKLQWYFGEGNGNFNNPQVVNSNNQYSNIKPALRAGDIDNDKDLDIFVLLNDSISNSLTVFKNEMPVGIDEKDLEIDKISITPNLVKSNTYVQFTMTENQNLSMATYNLYSTEGAKLKAGNLKDRLMLVPGVSAGIYIVEINLEDKTYIEKIFVN